MVYTPIGIPRRLDTSRKRVFLWGTSLTSPLYSILAGIILLFVFWVASNEWYYAISWPPSYAYYSFRRRWVVLYTKKQAAAEAAYKRSLPRYSIDASTFPDFPFYVISLPDATERRESATDEMKKHKIDKWEFFDAINGSDHMPYVFLFKWLKCH
jgi:hypothetical protein